MNDFDQFKKQLGDMTIAQLRQEAVNVYKVSISREHTKEDIIGLILGKAMDGTDYVREVKDKEAAPDRGFSTVTVSNSTGQNDIVCRVFHNGYQVSIPFDVEVQIPTVTADYIKTLRAQKLTKPDNGNFLLDKHVEWVPKYGVTFHKRDDGPCPYPDKFLEKRREALLRPKREFFKKHGFWPSDKKLRDPAYKD